MDFIKIQGNEQAVINEFSHYMNQGGAKSMVRCLPLFSNILDADETFQKRISSPQTPAGYMGWMSMHIDYFINIKKTTIALLGLILDIKFTQGFASFVLDRFGITADSIRKLSLKEKCVLLLIRARAVMCEEDGCEWAGEPVCMNESVDCSCRQENHCSLSKKELDEGIKTLMEHGVIKKSGQEWKLCF